MIYVVCGPTGVGKTKLSVMLAKKYDGIVVNADSMQVYKYLDIGTAKVTESEKEGVPHLLFDIVNPNELYTVFDYQRDLRKVIEENKGKNIILVGGSGLYIKAGLYDYKFALEEENQNNYENFDNETLYKMVKELDENTDIHVNNRKRLIRRLNQKCVSCEGNKLLYDALFIGLTTSREKLYERINKRVDEMVADGLINEVKSLYDKNIRSKAIMTGIGYKELYEYFDSKLSLEEAIDLIKKRSRHYAKRQYTWFNNQMNIKWFDVDFNNFDNTFKSVVKYIEENK